MDPVVATKIHFTKDYNELQNFVDSAALPGNITGDKEKKTLDEKKIEPVPPGKLGTPATPAYQEYQNMIKEYQIETLEWAKAKSVEGGEVAARHELARQYRLARFGTELDIRGPTSYQAKGLVTIKDNRVLLNYGSDGWTPLDITESV